MKYIKYFEQENEYNSFINSDEYILPNVSYVENSNVVNYNPHIVEKIPTIYATYDTNLIIPDMFEEGSLFCVNNNSNIKTLTINGNNIPFEQPTKQLKSIEVSISSDDILNNTCPDNMLYDAKNIIKTNIKPKNLNDSYNGFVMFKEGSWLTMLSNLFPTYGCNYTNINLCITSLIVGTSNTNIAVCLANISDDIVTPIDTIVECTYYDGGLTSPYYFPQHGVYDVKIELMEDTINCNLLLNFELMEVPRIKNITLENIKYIDFYGIPFINETINFNGIENISMYTPLVFMGKSLTIPKSFKSGSMAFLQMPYLEELTFEKYFQFSFMQLNLSNLSKITCYETSCPELINGQFSNVSPTGVLTVPAGSDYSPWLERLGDGWTVEYM